MSTRIFVSHSDADEKLASALAALILSAMVIDGSDLRCTSVPGHKLPVGSDFAGTLVEDIGESLVVIGLITKNALSSSWVLFELGATWGAKKNLKPLVTDEVDLSDLPGPMSGRHIARLSRKGDLNQFIEEIADTVGVKLRSATRRLKPTEQLLAAHAEHLKTATTSFGLTAVSAIEGAQLPMYLTDENLVVIACNDKLLEFFDVKKDHVVGRRIEFLGNRLSEIVPKTQRRKFLQDQARIIAEGRVSRNLRLIVEVDRSLRPGALQIGQYRVTIDAHFMYSERGREIGSFVVFHPEQI